MMALSLKIFNKFELVITVCLFNYIPIYIRNKAIKIKNKYLSVSLSIVLHKSQQRMIP